MPNLDEFIASVKTQGMMRSNRYTVTMGDVVNDPDNLRQIMMYCADVQLPGVNMSTAQLRTYGELREVPYEKLFGDINLTFYVDTNMNVKNYFDRWMGLIQDPYTRSFNYYTNYIAQMVITVEDYSNNAQYDINLYECYPKQIGQIQIGYDQKDIMKLQVTMQYKYWTALPMTELADGQKVPTNWYDKMMSNFSGFQKTLNETLGPQAGNFITGSAGAWAVSKLPGILKF